MEKIPPQQFKTPEEEISFLRAELDKRSQDKNISPEHPQEFVRNYTVTPASQVLHPENTIPDRHADMIALGLAEEEHDNKVVELLALIPEKGIKNVLTIVEKMNNPHLLDDIHRALVAYLQSSPEKLNLTEKDPLYKTLDMRLYEVRLAEKSEEDSGKKLSELIAGMEQFYSGMMSVSESGKSNSWFTIEIANENGQNHFSFYVSVPASVAILLEKQVTSIFPNATVVEQHNDYNIFNENGFAVGTYATLDKHAIYPLSTYESFEVDPLSVILNSFSKIDRDGEGAAIQLVIGPRQDEYSQRCFKALEDIRNGELVSEAIAEIDRGTVMKVARGFTGIFKNTEQEAKEKEKKQERAGQIDQGLIEQFTNKLRKPLSISSLRVVTSSGSQVEAEAILSDIKSAFSQFHNSQGNQLLWQKISNNQINSFCRDFSFRQWNDAHKLILNLSELTSIIHFPSTVSSEHTPQLHQNQSANAPAPSELPTDGTLLGINKYRGAETEVRISDEDRLRHFYIIGQTGTGKTTLMKNMITQDIEAGHGVCMIDPHGTDITDVIGAIPPEREDDVIYFDPARLDQTMGLNMLGFDQNYPEQKTFVVNELFSIFQKLYGAVPESMGPMFEQYFRNATLLVLEDPESGSTLLDISRVFANEEYRKYKLSKARNQVVVQFWSEIANKAGGEAALENIVPYITSKFDIFTANDFMRPIIGQQNSSFNFRQIMDEKKILLVNLSKGRLGEINANLIGMIVVGKILMAALSRVDDVSRGYPPFFLHMDEFQNITTDSISAILSEARKYKLGLTVAHQFIAQLDEKISNAVFGNVGSMAAFRVGPEDAEFLERQFSPTFTEKDLMNIENRQAYLRILANGTPQKPFNIHTMPPKEANPEKIKELIDRSYEKYARPRRQVEMEIASRYI